MIGWLPGYSDKFDYFYVVYDEQTKDKVLEIIEKEKAEKKERLLKHISRDAKLWFSYGSENEVTWEMFRDLRPLYEIQVNAKYPLLTEPATWKIRKVEDVGDGYVEFLPDPRYPLEIVEKKRVTVAVQVFILL